MDSDSLDWIWEDFVSPGTTDQRVSDHDDDDDGGGGDNDGSGDNDRGNRFYFDDNGDRSAATDDSSESSVGSALMTGDERTARELNEIVDDIKRR